MTAYPHNLHTSADVYSSDGEKLGELKRVVVRRSDFTLTHVVVDIGFRRSGRALWDGGLGLDYDRIIPIAAVATATDDRVDLNLPVDEFKASPEYTDESFEAVADPSPNEFDITDVTMRGEVIADAIASTPGAWVTTRLNKSVDSADLAEGVDVWRQEPHQKIGDLKRVLVDERTGQVSALVVQQGFILKHDIIVPVRYITEILDGGVVRVDLTDDDIALLRPYTGTD
jgi:sporulation protein YlmC with PRC-barrel domain